jgi:hypothetical protein
VKQTNRSAHVLHRLHSPEGPTNAQLRDDPERSKEDARQPTDSLRPSRMSRPSCDYGSETKLDEGDVSIDFSLNIQKRAKHLDGSLLSVKPERYRRSGTPSFDYLNIESTQNQKFVLGMEMFSNWGAIEVAKTDEEEKLSDDNPLEPSMITSAGYRRHPGKSVRDVSHWDSQEPNRIIDHAKKNRLFGMIRFQWRASKGGEHPALKPVEENQSRPASKAKWSSRLAKKLQAVGKRRW